MRRQYFVTGSGTDIGKTYVTAALIRGLRGRGHLVDAIKPVISGFDPGAPETSDIGILHRALARDMTPASIARMSPWRFLAPLSPDMAAAREGRSIVAQEAVAFARACAESGDAEFFFAEGAGGVLVPLSQTHMVRDLISALKWPAILVGGTYLGSISHTLTALEALQRNASVACIVLSESTINPVPPEETRAAVERFAGYVPVHIVARDGGAPDALLDLLTGD